MSMKDPLKDFIAGISLAVAVGFVNTTYDRGHLDQLVDAFAISYIAPIITPLITTISPQDKAKSSE